ATGGNLVFHQRIMGVMGFWCAAACGFQALLDRPATEEMARYGWAVTDVALLTIAMGMTGEPIGPLAIGYPLVLVAAGLWFSVRLVVLTTVVELASYVVLLWFLGPKDFRLPHYQLIFGASLAVIGAIVAYQVHRIGSLSRYFDRQRQG
ncbi:MAG TPA: hypothetical protein VMF30_06220, partial [Pirellulales bacterium]|nr:hypothetical protein [Pirellulales bacterium]